jgi:biopolymer transport protein ExbB/TolQ
MSELSSAENTEIVQRLLDSRLLHTDWVLYFLLGIFVLGAIVVAWKIVYFIVNAVRSRALRVKVGELVRGGSLDSFVDDVKDLPGIEAGVLRQAMAFSANGPDVVEQQMDVELANSKQRMELGLTFLGTVGANAPFVGLYGTVGGIVKAFRDLSAETEAGLSSVIAGIAEALVATAVGLIVAIPAVVAYNYLQKQVKKTMISSQGVNKQVLFRLRAAEEADS